MPMSRLREFVVAAAILGSIGSASAVPTPSRGVGEGASGGLVQSVAMCGRSCRSGGRYVQGPPQVCAEVGLNYCGPSGGGYGRRGPPVGYDRGYDRGYGYGGPPPGPRPGPTWYGYGPGRCGATLC